MENGGLVAITTRRETLLVIFEFLARSYDGWRDSENIPRDEISDATFVLLKPDTGERVALWRLEGEIESTLPEMFSSNYHELIKNEKVRLKVELYGS